MSANMAQATGVKPEVASEEEIRFAVVMYGGVSLAIYINGVAQELFNMVCATAPDTPGGNVARLASDDLKSSQRVYRKIGQFAEHWRLLHQNTNRNAAEEKRYRDFSKALATPGCGDTAAASEPIRTRFIVDVLSGTSAGGINSIYLAKALANTQGLDGIKKLWISAGDMATLINDHISVADLPNMSVAEPPSSLLNSHRMYRKLLDAFADMRNQTVGARVPEGEDSPLVDELDLFITTTDIRGLTLPIKLTDKVVYEKRHRNVFHFRYTPGEGNNDFVFANDPFLAFAARCTSSFPFAFEPMSLADINAFKHPAYSNLNPANPLWKKFYSEYWRSSLIEVEQARFNGAADAQYANPAAAEAAKEEARTQLQKEFLTRSFGDGGYLDNKPFSYATSKLMRRRADLPVKRKLLYVEPVPQHPEFEQTIAAGKPDFAANIRAALFDLPTKEMIREDIERVLERNQLLGRISIYANQVDDDIAAIKEFPAEQESKAEPVSVLLNRYGVSYGAYHRIRVEDVSARLAGAMSRVAGFDPSSSACAAVRGLVNAWRELRFHPEVDSAEGTPRYETRFLYQFDLQYPLRRLAFLSRRINQLSRLDGVAKTLLETWWKHTSGGAEGDPLACASDSDWGAAFKRELGRQKKFISTDRTAWRTLDESIARKTPAELGFNPDFKMNWQRVTGTLELPADERKARFAAIVRGKEFDGVEAFISAEREELGKHLQFKPASNKAPLSDPAAVALACLSFYYSRYAFYDLVTFPVQYGTGSGEANEIEVFRISPEDAKQLIDEGADTRRKLAGTAVMNFGAFLEEAWRRNDMLWGRLDAAERIIQAAMPVAKNDPRALQLRNDLIREAQEAILQEDLSAHDRKVLDRMLVRHLHASLPAFPDKATQYAQLKALLGRRELTNTMHAVIQSCLNEKGKLWEYYSSSYTVDRDNYDREQAVRSIARATAVTGRMLQALAREHRVNERPFAWLSMFGSMFWGMVEVAVPQSLWNLLWRHWISVLYIVDLIVIGGGIALNHDYLTKFGWMALAVTIGLHITVKLVGYYIGGRANRLLWKLPKMLLGAGIAALIAGGVLFFVDLAKSRIGDLNAYHDRIFYWTAGAIIVLLSTRDLIKEMKRYWMRFKAKRKTKADAKAQEHAEAEAKALAKAKAVTQAKAAGAARP
jgi:patatin-related protein